MFRAKEMPVAETKAPAKFTIPGESAWTQMKYRWGLAKPPNDDILRQTMSEISLKQSEKLNGYYVRLRYNDQPLVIPGCKAEGNHREGDESLCTLVGLNISKRSAQLIGFLGCVQDDRGSLHAEELEASLCLEFGSANDA